MHRKRVFMSVDNLIIDGTNLEFRIFYIAKNFKTTNDNNEQTSCIFRFLYTLKGLIEKFDPVNVYAAWDKKLDRDSTNFRKQLLIDQYKAGRIRPPDIQDMYDQEIHLIEIIESLGVRSIFPKVLEADDVCAFLADTLPGKNVVVSVDQDLLQLVSENTSVYNLKELITYENFINKKNIKPEYFVLYKAIKGDPSDNIPGIPGYGEVRARKLAEIWGNYKNIPEDNRPTLSEDYKRILSRNLRAMDLRYGYEYQPGEKECYEHQLEYVRDRDGDINKFKKLCEKHGFNTYIDNIDEWKKIVNRNNIFKLINKLL